ncbi:hypothetical protein THF1A12_60165 [Vibrio jasicida]|uniref:Uncharacterized protein n=1 Tax=Vibrio jasicida TaxID=766224 RepID=A0AAU9QVB4_9VIBR|nr:hypothetical protein THF1A12_60165 [Vibrio jasicida]
MSKFGLLPMIDNNNRMVTKSTRDNNVILLTENLLNDANKKPRSKSKNIIFPSKPIIHEKTGDQGSIIRKVKIYASKFFNDKFIYNTYV